MAEEKWDIEIKPKDRLLSVVFGGIAGIPTDGVPQPLSNVSSNLLRFGIQFLLFVAVYIYYALTGCPAHLNWYALLFPVLVLMMAGLALGFMVVLLAIGVVVFNKVQKSFMDTV